MNTKHLSDAHYLAILGHVSKTEDPDCLMVEILLRTGIRQDELVRLKRENFDLQRCVVQVRGSKKSNNRSIPFASELAQRLTPVLLKLGDRTLGHVLSGSEDLESHKRGVRRAFERVVVAVIGEHNYSVHSLRHTFALRCLRATRNDILKVQLIMGHKSLNSTAHYLRYLDAEDLHEDVLKAVG